MSNQLSIDGLQKSLHDENLAKAEYEMATLLLNGVSVDIKKDIKAAEKLLKKSSDAGFVVAHALLYKLYSTNEEGIKRDQEKALKYLEKASDGGLPAYQLEYAIHLHRVGTLDSLEKAHSIYQKLESDSTDDSIRKVVYNNLAVMHKMGSFVEKDSFKSVEYFKKAADLGYLRAQISLAEIYLGESNFDHENAVKYLTMTIENNSEIKSSKVYSQKARAKYLLAKLYVSEGYKEFDYQKSIFLLSEIFDMVADSNVGLMLAREAFVGESNPEKTFEILSKINSASNANVGLALALMYENGYGCKKSNSKAMKALNSASKLGSKDADKMLEELEVAIDEGEKPAHSVTLESILEKFNFHNQGFKITTTQEEVAKDDAKDDSAEGKPEDVSDDVKESGTSSDESAADVVDSDEGSEQGVGEEGGNQPDSDSAKGKNVQDKDPEEEIEHYDSEVEEVPKSDQGAYPAKQEESDVVSEGEVEDEPVTTTEAVGSSAKDENRADERGREKKAAEVADSEEVEEASGEKIESVTKEAVDVEPVNSKEEFEADSHNAEVEIDAKGDAHQSDSGHVDDRQDVSDDESMHSSASADDQHLLTKAQQEQQDLGDHKDVSGDLPEVGLHGVF